MKINGKMHYHRRAVDQKGELLDAFATRRWDRMAVLALLSRAMTHYGRLQAIVTDRQHSYRTAMKAIGIEQLQMYGCGLNDRAENSHQPFRIRGEGAMARFRDIKTLQKFTAALAEWRDMVA
mgnify:FL=1